MTTINDKIKNGEVYLESFDESKVRFEKVFEKDLDKDGRKYGESDTNYLNRIKNTQEATIESVCDGLKEFLLAKNKNYGNSATEPLRVFSNSNANEGILVRIDDKLSRIKNGKELKRNDITDLCGYLVLLLKNNGWDNFEDMVD